MPSKQSRSALLSSSSPSGLPVPPRSSSNESRGDLPLLIPVNDALRLLSIGRTKCYELMTPNGPMPAVKLGRRSYVRRSDLERFVADLPGANLRGCKTA